MAEVARALPRHWDGHRLLRFLTGLALLALAFAAPVFAVPAADTPPAAVRTVTDVSTAARADDPAAASAPAAVRADASRPAAVRADAAAAEEQVGAVPAAPHPAVALPDGDSGAHAADRPVILLAGAARAAHGSRGPPLR